MDVRRIKIQKVDRRMTGYLHFKYRLEFPWSAFNGKNDIDPYRNRAKAFYEFCKHLTAVFGYGPSVDDAGTYGMAFDEVPQWAFRLNSNTHTYAVYVADEAGREELEKIISFNILKH